MLQAAFFFAPFAFSAPPSRTLDATEVAHAQYLNQKQAGEVRRGRRLCV